MSQLFCCDFCSSQPVAWRYPAETFVMGVFKKQVHQSIKDWAACEACHGLIEVGNRVALLARSVACYQSKYGYEPQAEEMIRLAHDGFFEHRTGQGKKIEEVVD